MAVNAATRTRWTRRTRWRRGNISTTSRPPAATGTRPGRCVRGGTASPRKAEHAENTTPPTVGPVGATAPAAPAQSPPSRPVAQPVVQARGAALPRPRPRARGGSHPSGPDAAGAARALPQPWPRWRPARGWRSPAGRAGHADAAVERAHRVVGVRLLGRDLLHAPLRSAPGAPAAPRRTAGRRRGWRRRPCASRSSCTRPARTHRTPSAAAGRRPPVGHDAVARVIAFGCQGPLMRRASANRAANCSSGLLVAAPRPVRPARSSCGVRAGGVMIGRRFAPFEVPSRTIRRCSPRPAACPLIAGGVVQVASDVKGDPGAHLRSRRPVRSRVRGATFVAAGGRSTSIVAGCHRPCRDGATGR